jgi:hypothetical protein
MLMEEKYMGQVKEFLREEKASSEAVSSVVLIACAAILLSAGLLVYWGAFNGFFNTIAGWVQNIGAPPAIQ